MAEKLIETGSIGEIIGLFGGYDENIKIIEKELSVRIINRETVLKIEGEEKACDTAEKVIGILLSLIRKGETLNEQNIRYVLSMAENGQEQQVANMAEDTICISAKGKPVKPKTLGQEKYIKAIAKNTITLGIGPAGTGKTYLAVAMAVKAFRNKEVSRIILTRPAVEAGEKLGFLPGDLQTKIDPYLRPLYDGLYDTMGYENYQRNVERGLIEIAPLAYMRGRTLDDAFIILDEAQNTTPQQMKMFLTRIGFGSKAIVTGDITQIDLPGRQTSGLKEALKILKDIEGIAICNFSEKDVVRHPLVQKIIKAYEKYEFRKDVVKNESKKRYILKK